MGKKMDMEKNMIMIKEREKLGEIIDKYEKGIFINDKEIEKGKNIILMVN